MEEQVGLDRVLSKVRGLIAKAESLGLDNPEGKACQERADAMMEQYAIDQAKLRESVPVVEQVKPGHMDMDICPAGSPYEAPITSLVVAVAKHCRCQVIFSRANMNRDLVEELKAIYATEFNVIARVFGYQSDLKYFEILFTVLHLHMAGGYDPKVNWSASDEDNAYVLHSAGLNWRAIARAFGPSHPMGWDGVIRKDDGGHLGRAGAYWHACYRRAVRARGEQEIKLPKFSDGSAKLIEYRYNFAESYASTVNRRLTEIRNSRQSGGELVLASSAEKIRDMINEMFPERGTIDYGAKPAFNPNAWAAGNKRGLEADLNANTRVSNPARPELS